MTDVSTYLANSALNWSSGKTAMPSLPSIYVGLLTGISSDGNGTGEVEVSGGGYARVATTGASWGPASGSVPVTAGNASAITFPASTGAWGTILGFRLWDALTGGNRLMGGYLGAGLWLPFTCTAASPGVVTAPGHGFSNGDQVVVTGEFGGTLPPTAGSWAGLLTVSGVTADTFTLGVNTTGSGMGMVRKVAPYILSSGATTLAFSAGQLVLSMG